MEKHLLTRAENEETYWMRHHRKCVQATSLTAKLPDDVLELVGQVRLYVNNTLDLTFHEKQNDIDVLRFFKLKGVAFKHSHAYDDLWKYEGKGIFNGVTCDIGIYSEGTPDGCHIEEYQETVTKLKAICNKTGEEL